MAYASRTSLYKTVTITSAQLLALRATPITLVPAPDTLCILEFVSAALQLDFNSAAYVEGAGLDDNLVVRYSNSTGTIASEEAEMTGFIDQSADAFQVVVPTQAVRGLKSDLAGKSLVLHNVGDEEFITGNSPLRVDITYRVILAV